MRTKFTLQDISKFAKDPNLGWGWDDVQINIGGKTIKNVVSINYTYVENLQKIAPKLRPIPPQDNNFEYYYKRKDKCFLRNSVCKIVIPTGTGIETLKYGTILTLEIS